MSENNVNLTKLVLLVECSDGTTRMVDIQGKHPRKIVNFLKHLQGGRLRLTHPVAHSFAEITALRAPAAVLADSMLNNVEGAV